LIIDVIVTVAPVATTLQLGIIVPAIAAAICDVVQLLYTGMVIVPDETTI
jgi:aspartate ammonia-lyase